MPVSLYDLSVIGIVGLAIGLAGFVTIIALGAWCFRELTRGQAELKRGQGELTRGQGELKRLDIVIGGFVYQEDEKTRALITARFDELMRQLPR